MAKCEKGMSFQDCEMLILRNAVDKAEQRLGKKKVNAPEVARIISIVEMFLKSKKLVCYGGTAINNILPKADQFYNKDIEIPDYDFFSPNAMTDAKELADIYYKEGFTEVEAKAGQHYGTYKVFVNFIPVADITNLPKELYKTIYKDAIRVAGIYYSPPNFLRMLMYLELSRPAGDVGRWEKVLKRLTLLNKNYPLRGKHCPDIDFQREFEEKTPKARREEDEIYHIVRNSFIDQGVIFFGGFANVLYSRYLPKKMRMHVEKVPDFDILSDDPETTALIVKERLEDYDIKHIRIIKKEGIGEILAPHYEVRVGPETVAFIYKPLACHSYNIIKIKGNTIKVATIDTMLSFYLSFLFINRPYYDKNRILCMAHALFKVQQKNRLQQKGLLKRFSINCYGEQPSIEAMRAEKTEKFQELSKGKNKTEYERWFLRYIPRDVHEKKEANKLKSKKGQKTKKGRKSKKGQKTKKGRKSKKIKGKKGKKSRKRKVRRKRKTRRFAFMKNFGL